MKKPTVFQEAEGWYGSIAIMLAYVLVSFNIISSGSLTYQFLNLTGALGIMVIAYVKGVKQSIVLNAFWALIALVAVMKIIIG